MAKEKVLRAADRASLILLVIRSADSQLGCCKYLEGGLLGSRETFKACVEIPASRIVLYSEYRDLFG
jgi:hypothetical protein